MKSFPDFITYMQSLWGDSFSPFPWQVRLADALATKGEWPEWITLPTGTGKTSVLDIAVYALAHQLHHSAQTRTIPVRIVLAVNRRIVVDDAFNRASQIQNTLADALHDQAHPLNPVSVALKDFAGSGSESPLEAYPLRGASFTDNSWARTPTQPLIITSTLDQLGSRILFRGYGVSDGSLPIHAALLANDSLLILDEAHTEHAFSQTLETISQLRKNDVSTPFKTIQLTATPPVGQSGFTLNDDDKKHPIIEKRIGVRKPTILLPEVAGAKKSQRHKKLAVSIGSLLDDIYSNDNKGPKRVLVVCNRVATCEELTASLQARKGKLKLPAQVHLLTGRLRPLDRDKLLADLVEEHKLKDTSPPFDVSPLVLISTQTIEVGADLDFDILISELAPLDNLRQRFGRLNRYGREIEAQGFILAPEEALNETDDDPIYGPCLPRVWKWLTKHQDGLDFGSTHLAEILPTDDDLNALLAPPTVGPILLPEYLDLLAQTSPKPHVEPDVSFLIHGEQQSFAQVEVALRSDLTFLDEEKLKALPDAAKRLMDCPPLVTECATLPLGWLRSWLTNDKKTLFDTGADSAGDDENKLGKDGIIQELLAWRITSDGPSLIANPSEISPGDRIILPTQLSRDKLNQLLPLSQIEHGDLDQYERAHLAARDMVRIRIDKTFLVSCRNELPAEFPTIDDDNDTPPVPLSSFIEKLAKKYETNLTWKRIELTRLDSTRWRITTYGDEGFILSHLDRVGHTAWPLSPSNIGSQGDNGETDRGLDEHQIEVDRLSRTFAHNTGLPHELIEAITFAARYHDTGKQDPRFQAMLYGTSPFGALGRPAIAKSQNFRSRSSQASLRHLAELPDGFRHELVSCEILRQSSIVTSHLECDLILHLVASHHGRCRPLAPVTIDDSPEPFSATIGNELVGYEGQPSPLLNLSCGTIQRYSSLTRRFGWWGLAYLETLLRLADQRVSAGVSSPLPPEK